MRLPCFAALALLLGCQADLVPLPDASAPADAGPCGGACGAGTVCQSGACVAMDAGAEDRPATVDAGAPDTGVDAGTADVGTDAGAADVPPDTYGACLENGIMQCDGRNIMTQLGEVDGGRTYHCGGCGNTCAIGEICLRCRCTR